MGFRFLVLFLPHLLDDAARREAGGALLLLLLVDVMMVPMLVWLLLDAELNFSKNNYQSEPTL